MSVCVSAGMFAVAAEPETQALGTHTQLLNNIMFCTLLLVAPSRRAMHKPRRLTYESGCHSGEDFREDRAIEVAAKVAVTGGPLYNRCGRSGCGKVEEVPSELMLCSKCVSKPASAARSVSKRVGRRSTSTCVARTLPSRSCRAKKRSQSVRAVCCRPWQTAAARRCWVSSC